MGNAGPAIGSWRNWLPGWVRSVDGHEGRRAFPALGGGDRGSNVTAQPREVVQWPVMQGKWRRLCGVDLERLEEVGRWRRV